MSASSAHGRTLDDAPGVVGISASELPSLPDDCVTNPHGARLDPRAWFADPSRRFELEIGSGKGTFLVQQVEADLANARDHTTHANYLGIEWTREFYMYGADRVRRRRESGTHRNVRMLHTDATQLLKWRVPDGVIDVIHLYFSDPWPKAKHHKKRVVQHWSMAEFWRTLRPGGELRIVTDHDDLWAWMDAHFDAWTTASGPGDTGGSHPYMENAAPPAVGELTVPLPRLTREALVAHAESGRAFFERLGFDRPKSAREGELVGTNFERKFIEQGRTFNAGVLRKPAL